MDAKKIFTGGPGGPILNKEDNERIEEFKEHVFRTLRVDHWFLEYPMIMFEDE